MTVHLDPSPPPPPAQRLSTRHRLDRTDTTHERVLSSLSDRAAAVRIKTSELSRVSPLWSPSPSRLGQIRLPRSSSCRWRRCNVSWIFAQFAVVASLWNVYQAHWQRQSEATSKSTSTDEATPKNLIDPSLAMLLNDSYHAWYGWKSHMIPSFVGVGQIRWYKNQTQQLSPPQKRPAEETQPTQRDVSMLEERMDTGNGAIGENHRQEQGGLTPFFEFSKEFSLKDLLEAGRTLPIRKMQSNACFDSDLKDSKPGTSSFRGLLHIAMGDIGGAAITAFFQFVIGQLIYADQNQLKPWVYFNRVTYTIYDAAVHGIGAAGVDVHVRSDRWIPSAVPRPDGHWRDVIPGGLVEAPRSALERQEGSESPQEIQRLHFEGTGIWDHYFEPVSDFIPASTNMTCPSGQIPNPPYDYVTLNLTMITPGIHQFAEWAPRCWRYKTLPDYISKPHIPVTEWLEPQRVLGHSIVQKYIQVRQYLQHAAEHVNPGCHAGSVRCLALHIRHSDKASHRRVVQVPEFLPFVEAFLHAGGDAIYLATDSMAVLGEISSMWPDSVKKKIRTAGPQFLRSSDATAVFDLGENEHHRTNIEVLVELLAMARCQFMIHGFSAVSEAAIWINVDLHPSSVNLEDPDHLSPSQFGTLVQMAVRGEQSDRWPRPLQTDYWWKQPPLSLRWPATQQSWPRTLEQPSEPRSECTGYLGVLWISSTGPNAAARSFFGSILNQLLYADMYNLKPWIHLRNTTSALIFDSESHGPVVGSDTARSWNMLRGNVSNQELLEADEFKSDATFPGEPRTSKDSPFIPETTKLHGNGVWETYFDQVSDFRPGAGSCQNFPVIELDQDLVSRGIQLYSPWAIRAWRYDRVPAELWWKDNGDSLKEWYKAMRDKGHDIVKKYYRFQPHILERVHQIIPSDSLACLGIHLRNSDKTGKYRTKIKVDAFRPYMEAFASSGGRCIYVASDSHRTLQYIHNNYPEHLTRLVTTQGKLVVRSFKEWPAHMIDSHHRVNSEVLVDILALSKCKFLLHGFSSVSEAAIYINPTLHAASINLEAEGRIASFGFGDVFKNFLSLQDFHHSKRSNQLVSPVSGKIPIVVHNLDNATISVHQSQRQCRSNAIVFLAQKFHSSYGRDSYASFMKSINLLVENYLSKRQHLDNADIFIFHSGDFDDNDLKSLISQLGAQYIGIVYLVNLADSPFWARPKHHTNDKPQDWYAWPLFSEGYRKMMHFFAIDIWEFFSRWNEVSGCSYDYVFRLDEDSYIHSPIEYDVFDFMRSNQFIYGYRMCSYEMKVTQRMLAMWNNRHPDFVPQRPIELEMCGFYNNLFVASIPFFRSPEVSQFLRFVDRQGQIFRRRLGDLMIHSMAVYMFAPPRGIHRFLDFTYEHSTVNKTDGCLLWGGIQAGYADDRATKTLDTFYETKLVKRGCPGNATFLTEEDLSPSYAHIPKHMKGKVSLLTITAGRVELPPGKGRLSG